MSINYKIFQGDSLSILKTLDSESVDCVVTSPPYLGLRKYSDDSREIGRETHYQEYVDNLCSVFHEMKRILKSSGIFFLNLGDSYAGSGRGQTRDECTDEKRGKMKGIKLKNSINCGLHAKNLIGIPWRVALALQNDGWILRNDIIWEKPNCMPDSVKDRCTVSHEYIFMFSKSPKYFYDREAIQEKSIWAEKDRRSITGATVHNGKTSKNKYSIHKSGAYLKNGMRNKRTVWSMNTKSFRGAHFATFPLELPLTCLKAGCSRGGTVLDPFCGAATTGLACQQLGINFIGIELNQKYVDLAMERLNYNQTLGI